MGPHPAYVFFFTPQINGDIAVLGRSRSPVEVFRKNAGMHLVDGGGMGTAALLPATYLKACQIEADELDGLSILHRLER